MTALTLSACSGGETNNTQQVTNVENNSSSTDGTNSAPDKATKPRRRKKVNYDNLAQTFLLEDMREIYSITEGFHDVYTPSALCFNYWHKRGEYTPTKEQKGNCQLWVQEVADLYKSYGYMTPADTFKSELFWNALEKYANNEYIKAVATARNNNTVTPKCPTRPQKGYKTPELIEDGKKSYRCKRYEKQ